MAKKLTPRKRLEEKNFKLHSSLKVKGSEDKFYKANVEKLTGSIAFLKTEDPKDNGIRRIVPLNMVLMYLEEGFWKDVKEQQKQAKPTKPSRRISISAVIHYWVDKGLTNEQIAEKMPTVNKSTLYTAAWEARNDEQWRKRNVAKYEEYMREIKKSHSQMTQEEQK